MSHFPGAPVDAKDGEKSVSEVLTSINFADMALYQMDDNELKGLIDEMQTAAAGRSPAEVDKENFQKFKTAMNTAKIARVESEKGVLRMDEVKDSSIVELGVDEKTLKHVAKASVVFAFVHGNVTEKKYWVRMTQPDAEKKSLFCSWPHLDKQGSRSTLVHIHRELISSYLKKGMKNAILAVLEKAEIKIKDEKKQFAFPKGHLLVPQDDIQKVRADLTNIFTQMSKPVADRKFELKYFTV